MANWITKVKKLRENWDRMKAEEPVKYNQVVRRIEKQQAANKAKKAELKRGRRMGMGQGTLTEGMVRNA